MFEKKFDIKNGDTITIESQGIKATGEVFFAQHWGEEDGWHIEMMDNTGVFRNWKQSIDGGQILSHVKKGEL